MDDSFEFENNEYRLASMQMKAIAYDVVTEITRKKLEIKKRTIEEEKQKELITSLTSISDKIVELTDEFEHQLQQLDNITEETEGIPMTNSTQEQQKEQPPQAPKEEVVEEKVEEEKTSIKPQPVVTIEKQTPVEPPKEIVEKKEEEPKVQEEKVVDEDPIKPQSVVTVEKEPVVEPPKEVVEKKEEPKVQEEKTPSPIVEPIVKTPTESPAEPKLTTISQPDSKEEVPEPSNEPVIQEIVTEQEPNKEEKVEEVAQQATKEDPEVTITSSISSPIDNSKDSTVKRFQKMTKNLSKAIMVRPNQLENLRKSRLYQEQLLISKGLFQGPTETTEPIPKPEQTPKELPDNIERQIEDLTVKANIYYNEGELDKAQELYDQIKALNKEYQ